MLEQHHKLLFYHILEGQEKLSLPIQPAYLEQKQMMLLLEMGPFRTLGLESTKGVRSCSHSPQQLALVLPDSKCQ